MKTVYTLLLSGLLVSAASSFAATPRSIDYTHKAVASDATIHISNLAGNVKIVGWNKNDVHVTGTLGDNRERLEVNGNKDDLTIKVVYPNYDEFGSDLGSSGSNLVIHIPKRATVQATTVSAGVSAYGVSGVQRIRTVSGDITLETKASEINAQTVSGDIDVKGSAPGAHVELETVSGDTQAFEVAGELRGQTVSGHTLIARSRLKRAHLSSTSGQLEFDIPVEDDGDYKFSTVSGHIYINLPKRPNAEFDLTTFSGSIHNNFGPKPKKASPYTPSLELHFTNGKGGAYVNASSMSGSISLKAGSS